MFCDTIFGTYPDSAATFVMHFCGWTLDLSLAIAGRLGLSSWVVYLSIYICDTCICIYIYIYAYRHIYIYIYIYEDAHTSVYVYIYISIDV
jgi:hypothetical protein